MDVDPRCRVAFLTETAKDNIDATDAHGADRASFTSCHSRFEKGIRRGLYFHSLTSLNETSKAPKTPVTAFTKPL
jgi:hypothetical protein